jgi:hypothetical protein
MEIGNPLAEATALSMPRLPLKQFRLHTQRAASSRAWTTRARIASSCVCNHVLINIVMGCVGVLYSFVSTMIFL